MENTSGIIEIADAKTCPQLQYQRELFPIEIIEFYPYTPNSADLKLIGSGRNGKDYAIKKTSDGKGMIPATEFFCYALARQVNIGTPDYDILALENGELAFGSVWEGGVHLLANVNEVVSILSGSLKINAIENFFAKVYAFDLFINNIDRHFGNYLFRKSFSDSYIALAYDFSRAWYEIDYKGVEAAKNSHCNTQQIFKTLILFKKIEKKQSQKTLVELIEIDQTAIERILSSMPETWMSKMQSDEILNWWGSQEFKDRSLILKEEINNVLV